MTRCNASISRGALKKLKAFSCFILFITPRARSFFTHPTSATFASCSIRLKALYLRGAPVFVAQAILKRSMFSSSARVCA